MIVCLTCYCQLGENQSAKFSLSYPRPPLQEREQINRKLKALCRDKI